MWQRPALAAWREPNLLPHRQQARRRLQRHGAVVWLTSMALWLAGVAIAGVWVEHERDATLATYQDWQRRWQARQGAPEVSGATAHAPTPAAVGTAAMDVLLALDALTRAQPSGVGLQQLRMASGWLELDGQTRSPQRVRDRVRAVQWPNGFAQPLKLVHVLRPTPQAAWQFRLRAQRGSLPEEGR